MRAIGKKLHHTITADKLMKNNNDNSMSSSQKLILTIVAFFSVFLLGFAISTVISN